MTRFRNAVVLSAGVIPSDCHPEQASFAQRGIWASRATGVPDTPGFGVAGWANRCEFTNDEKTARLARFPIGVRLPAPQIPHATSLPTPGAQDDGIIYAKSPKGTWVISPRSLWEKAQFGSGAATVEFRNILSQYGTHCTAMVYRKDHERGIFQHKAMLVHLEGRSSSACR